MPWSSSESSVCADPSQELSSSDRAERSSESQPVVASEKLSADDSRESLGPPTVSPSLANWPGMAAHEAPPSVLGASEDALHVHSHGACAVSNCTVSPP